MICKINVLCTNTGVSHVHCTYLTGVVHGISGHQEVTEEEKDFVNIYIPHTDIDHGTMYAHVLCVHVHKHSIPYSGNIWLRFIFGELAVLF